MNPPKFLIVDMQQVVVRYQPPNTPAQQICSHSFEKCQTAILKEFYKLQFKPNDVPAWYRDRPTGRNVCCRWIKGPVAKKVKHSKDANGYQVLNGMYKSSETITDIVIKEEEKH